MRKINFGIGFVTGRANVCDVINHYYQAMIQQVRSVSIPIHLTVFIAYDSQYQNTPEAEFYKITRECAEAIHLVYITPQMIARTKRKIAKLFSVSDDILSCLLGNGHAQGRNIIMLYALLYRMDYLLFWDDDEYPVACLKNNHRLVWLKQNNIIKHLAAMRTADVSIGYHCGYISPIPCFSFPTPKIETEVKRFISAIGNEIINWEDLKKKMEQTNGVTFADPSLLENQTYQELQRKKGAKWVAGSTLCLNLRHAQKIPAFYNPPRARGEDTFFSLRLNDLKVVRVPVYHFHDGFLTCRKIMKEEFPQKLKRISMNQKEIKSRFIQAILGWLRYKPLFVYLTDPRQYCSVIQDTLFNLQQCRSVMAELLGQDEFDSLLRTFVEYAQNVKRHDYEYSRVNQLWAQIKQYIIEPTGRENCRYRHEAKRHESADKLII